MNQGDFNQIQFRGKDATECEDFIAAILKHAFSQGKQRDDQWMADLAATCMANDALRWWISLDEEVQGSWKRLQRAMISKYRPMFHGGSGEEAEKFIRTVCDKAIDEGKQKDNEWAVTYASSCMAGEALRWYTHLDSDTQENWKKLQQAVLIQYPRGAPDGPPTLSLVPTPPQAAPAAPAPRTSYRGRIRISNSSCSTPHYLSKHLTEDRISHTSSLEDALEVECSSHSDGLQTLSVPDSQIPGYDVLGVKWSSNTSTPHKILAICAVDSRTGSTVLTSFTGGLLTKAWKLSPRESSGTDSTTLSSFSRGLLTKAWKPPSRGTHGDGPFTVSAMVGGEVLYPRWHKYVWFAASSYDPSYAADMSFEPV